MRGFLIFIYGVAILAIIYFVVQMLYSVYYTPGTSVLYNSPVTQQLFPGTPNKLMPQWGYTKQGLYKGEPTKYGQGQFWPENGSGYVPNKLGSGGPSPSEECGRPSQFLLNLKWAIGDILLNTQKKFT